MKKVKLKIRKQVWIALAVIIILSGSLLVIIQVKNNKEQKSNVFTRLQDKGYLENEINLLKEHFPKEKLEELANNEKDVFLVELFKDKYFIKDNLERYLDYHKSNESTEAKDTVSAVNTFNDYEIYEHDIEADLEKDNLVLINRFYHFNSDYKPDDLVNVSNKYYYGSNHKLRSEANEAFIKMWNAAYQEDIYLLIITSYRDYESQAKIYQEYKDFKGSDYADKLVARPGYSEHQTGLALDIFSKESTMTEDYLDTQVCSWLRSNAYKYGFIERYKLGKENITGFDAEPWHYRYVGLDAANVIYNNDITLEEYYAYFLRE